MTDFLQLVPQPSKQTCETDKYIEHLEQSNKVLEKLVQEQSQKLAETNHELRKSKTYLMQAQEITSMGSWVLDLETDAINCSEQVYTLLGLPKETKKLQTLTELLAFIPSNERTWVGQTIQDGKASGTYKIEHCLNIHGELRYVHQQGTLFFNEHTDKPELMCVMHDVTEYRETEQELLKLIDAIEHITDAIMIVDTAGTIEYVNTAFCNMTGYSKKELIGALDTLKIKTDYYTFYKHLKQVFKSQQTNKTVSLNRRKDGSRYYEERTVTPLNNKNHNITHYLLSCINVTDSVEIK